MFPQPHVMSQSRSPILLGLLTFLAVAANPAGAQELTDAERDAVRAVVERHADADTPGFTWALWREGAIVASGARGMADLERGVPLSVDSRFRIASTSKQFTAASVLALVEDGALDLETPVHQLLEEMHPFDPPVRLRHLVAHQSGLPDYLFLMDLKGYPPALPYSFDEAYAVLSRLRATAFEPGAAYTYSNTNYLLMGEIVRRTSGRTLREFAHERFFEPLGMEHSHFSDDRDELVPDRALGYERGMDGAWRLSMTPLELVGDGGLFTTVGDLFRWTQDMRHLREDRVGVLDAEAVKRQYTAFDLADGMRGDYAFGLLVEYVEDGRLVSHGGAFVGYRADCLHCPEAGWGVAVLFNRADGRPTNVGIELLNAIGVDTRVKPASYSERDPFDLDVEVAALPEWARRLRGEYLLSDGSPVSIRRVREFLRLRGPGLDLQLAAPSAEATRLVNRDSSLALARTELGLVLELEDGDVVRIEIESAPYTNEAFEGFAGRWYVPVLDEHWDLTWRSTRRPMFDVRDARGLRGTLVPVRPDLARGPLGSLVWKDAAGWHLWSSELGVLDLVRED